MVPVSTMPAVLVRIDVEVPYVIDWSMPKNSDAGEVEVIGLYAACHDVVVTLPEVPDGNSHKVDRTGKLGGIGATERELAVERTLFGRGLVEYSDGVVRKRALREEVIRHRRYGRVARGGALGEVDGADAQDAVDALEALRG